MIILDQPPAESRRIGHVVAAFIGTDEFIQSCPVLKQTNLARFFRSSFRRGIFGCIRRFRRILTAAQKQTRRQQSRKQFTQFHKYLAYSVITVIIVTQTHGICKILNTVSESKFRWGSGKIP